MREHPNVAQPRNIDNAAWNAWADTAARRAIEAWAKEEGRGGIATGKNLGDLVETIIISVNEALERRDVRITDLEARLKLLDGKKAKAQPAAGIVRKVKLDAQQ